MYAPSKGSAYTRAGLYASIYGMSILKDNTIKYNRDPSWCVNIHLEHLRWKITFLVLIRCSNYA